MSFYQKRLKTLLPQQPYPQLAHLLTQHTSISKSKCTHKNKYKHTCTPAQNLQNYQQSSNKIYKTLRNPRKKSIQSSIRSSSRNIQCCSRKRELIQSQIEDEYNMQKRPQKSNQKSCQYNLGNCKYITHYLKNIQDLVAEQRRKNQRLERMNQMLTKENRHFNQYFIVFQQRYKQSKIKDQKGFENQRRLKKSKSYSKNSDLYLSFKPHHQEKTPKEKPYKNQTFQRSDFIYENTAFEPERQTRAHSKKHSDITKSSSRKREPESYQTSKLDSLYTYY